MMDLFSDDTMVRFRLVELWLDMIEAEREDSRQLSGVNLEGAGVIQWLSKQYEDGSEEAKGLLTRCMSVGVELPEYEGDDHRYPPELYEAADFHVRGCRSRRELSEEYPRKVFDSLVRRAIIDAACSTEGIFVPFSLMIISENGEHSALRVMV